MSLSVVFHTLSRLAPVTAERVDMEILPTLYRHCQLEMVNGRWNQLGDQFLKYSASATVRLVITMQTAKSNSVTHSRYRKKCTFVKFCVPLAVFV